VNINGLTEESMLDNGLTIKWKEQEHSPGAMVENMLVSTRTTKSMEMEHSSGQMVGNILVIGKMESSTEKEFISKKAKIEKVYGKWVKELTGSKNNEILNIILFSK